MYRVLEAFAHQFDVQQGLDVFIEKKLPSQAGLGGGSSDAATALMVANQLWQLNHSKETLIDFAAPFGADIPCFIYGKASLARGIGEQLSDYPHTIPPEHVVLAWPNVGVSTAASFDHFDEEYFHALTKEKVMVKVRARSDGGDFDLGYNDLEKSSAALCPPLKSLLSVMRQQSVRAWMSGSGSTCVALCHSAKDATSLVDFITSQGLASWVHHGYFLSMHPLEKNGA
ncbi:MAG: 4-(cytidine 5'-diphospho)-2-C-methyl-D-erythritol kinase [Ghiorsea sp.]|nr:4-(cytidine 5'-diphospho)-2-C-methyl-D-erythritol kinase [Ghiorsea sp.]